MKGLDLYLKVRHAVRIEGLSERAAARRFGIDPRTVNKIMKFSVPPGYVRKKPPRKPKLDPFIAVIEGILGDDRSRGKKQQHTAKRIFERLRDEHGYAGGLTIVKDYVALWRQRAQEMLSCWCMRRDMRRPTSAKQSASSAVWNRRSTSLRWICRTATPASWRPIRRRRWKPSATATFGHSTTSVVCQSRF